MKHATNPIAVRIEWCRRQSTQARTEPEVGGWSAEADGLQDALLNSDHTDTYRLCPPEVLRRYQLGLRDGTALLEAARMRRVHAATTGTPQPTVWIGTNVRPGDDR
ncbi:MAG: hypothetical protein HP496_01370 [Nitrospira sp.]|nr:hypothetical protein [Nitrospira sp.]